MRREQGACHKVPCYGACGPAEDTPAGRACPPTMNLTSGSGFFDITRRPRPVCFSNRPFGVKRFQTTHHHSVDVARGLVLLFGIGTKALPSWDSKTRWNNLPGGLAVKLTVGSKRTCELTSSIVPRGTSFHRSVEFEFSSYAYAMACSRVHRNSVPSTQMRCRITARRRARATIAFFIPRRLAICIAQALSHDHFFERSVL